MRIPTHYYADVKLRIMRAQDVYPRPCARVTHTERRRKIFCDSRRLLVFRSIAYFFTPPRFIGLLKPVLSPIHFYVRILKLTVDNMSPQRKKSITRVEHDICPTSRKHLIDIALTNFPPYFSTNKV